jgi:hypothetical protein
MSQPTAQPTGAKVDNQTTFLTEVLNGMTRWKAEAARRKQGQHNNEKELEYAQAYQVLLHKFSQIETNE